MGALKNNSNILHFGNMQVYADTFQIIINGRAIKFTPIEYSLLMFFCKFNEQHFSRKQLLHQVWKKDKMILDRTVDSTIASLRRKTKDWDFKIKSIYGVGYRLNKKSTPC